MDFLQFAAERFSHRRFDPRPVEQEAIDKILACGHLAPTGCNNQPQRILVLKEKESLEQLKRCTKCHFNAPLAMLVCYDRTETWVRPYDGATSAEVDASIVTTHMMLMAHQLGIGSCWVMHFDPAAMRREFAIPENVIPHALLVMGYPHPESKPLPLHFESRDLSEVVYYEHF